MSSEIERAMTLYQSGDYRSAREAADSALVAHPEDIRLLLLSAAIHAALAEFDDVIAECERVLSLDPVNLSALTNAAVAADRTGHHAEVLSYLRRAEKLAPLHPGHRWMKIVASCSVDDAGSAGHEFSGMLQAGQVDDAMMDNLRAVIGQRRYGSFIDRMVKEAPMQPYLLYRQLLIRLDVGDRDAVADLLSRLERVAPGNSFVYRARLAQMFYSDGIAGCSELLASIPDEVIDQDPVLLHRKAHCQIANGDYAPALGTLQQCVRLSGDKARVLHDAGMVLETLRRYDDAISVYRQALIANPGAVASKYNLAFMLDRVGRRREALEMIRDCVRMHDTASNLVAYVTLVSETAFDMLSVEDHDSICRAIEDTRIDPRPLAMHAFAVLLRRSAVTRRLYDLSKADDFDGFHLEASTAIEDLCSDSLLLSLYSNLTVGEQGFEKFTTMLRRSLLMNFMQGIEALTIALCSTIAKRAFITGFIYPVTGEEKSLIDSMVSSLPPGSATTTLYPRLSVIAMYRPLHEVLPAAELQVPDVESSRHVDDMLKMHYHDRREEYRLQSRLETLGVLSDDVSRAVRSQYESNPYPVWERLDRRTPRPVSEVLRVFAPSMDVGDLPDSPNILVAGCGTGSHVVQSSMRIRHGGMTAIDLSRASLALAMRKCGEYGLDDIRFVHMDILDVSELGEDYDIIESIGVLHHMDSPATGLNALMDVLVPGGLIYLGFYSAIARRHILRARSLYNHAGGVSDDEIRAVRQRIMDADPDEMTASIMDTRDFYSLHDCRDLLFHEHEIDFELDQLSHLLRDVGLEFIGFDLPDRTLLDRFRQEQPGASEVDLVAWSSFERAYPDTFKGMYVFWCRKPA